MNLGGGELLLLLLVFGGFVGLLIVPWWQIFKKSGNEGWLSLLMFLPLVNIGMFLFLAFSDWPVLRELRLLRAQEGR